LTLPDGEYNITFYGNDSTGDVYASSLISFSVDTVPPGNITGLALAGNTSGSVTLSWNSSTDTDHVELWRDGVYITDVVGNTHTDTGLSSGTTYDYTLRPVDAAGNIGNWVLITASTELAVTTSSSSRRGGSNTGTDLVIRPPPEEETVPEEEDVVFAPEEDELMSTGPAAAPETGDIDGAEGPESDYSRNVLGFGILLAIGVLLVIYFVYKRKNL
jgi:hypothetical protein